MLTDLKPQVDLFKTSLTSLAESTTIIAKEVRKLFNTQWQSKETNKVWRVLNCYRDKGFFGDIKVILEDMTITYKGFKKAWYGKEHPTMKVPLSLFLSKIKDDVLTSVTIYEIKGKNLED